MSVRLIDIKCHQETVCQRTTNRLQYVEKSALKANSTERSPENLFLNVFNGLRVDERACFFHVRPRERIIVSEEKIVLSHAGATAGMPVNHTDSLPGVTGGSGFRFDRFGWIKGEHSFGRTILREKTNHTAQLFELGRGNLGVGRRRTGLQPRIFVFKRLRLEASRPWMTASKEGDA